MVQPYQGFQLESVHAMAVLEPMRCLQELACGGVGARRGAVHDALRLRAIRDSIAHARIIARAFGGNIASTPWRTGSSHARPIMLASA